MAGRRAVEWDEARSARAAGLARLPIQRGPVMSDHEADAPRAAPFPTTRWSRVVAAGDPAEPEARAALAELCRRYWYPIYAFIRRKGHDPDEALDLTQDYFARLLEKGVLAARRPRPGPLPRLPADRLRLLPGRPRATATGPSSAAAGRPRCRSTPATPRAATSASRPTRPDARAPLRPGLGPDPARRACWSGSPASTPTRAAPPSSSAPGRARQAARHVPYAGSPPSSARPRRPSSRPSSRLRSATGRSSASGSPPRSTTPTRPPSTTRSATCSPPWGTDRRKNSPRPASGFGADPLQEVSGPRQRPTRRPRPCPRTAARPAAPSCPPTPRAASAPAACCGGARQRRP